MLQLRFADGQFRLDRALPPEASRELKDRGLGLPRWDRAAHAWTFGAATRDVAAMRWLLDTGAIDAQLATRARLDELEGEVGEGGRPERVRDLETRLRPYQREGVAAILERKRVLLADSMGLGKSLQALVAIEKAEAYPAVVVCPAAVKLGWRQEVLKWTPWRNVQVLHAGRDKLQGAEITVLNPELLGRRLDDLQALKPKAVVLDEAHFFKNPGAQRSKNAMALVEGVAMRLALTGTPIKNRREDLLHQLRLLGQLENVLSIYRGILPHWWRPEQGPLPETHALNALARLDRRTLHERLKATCMVRRTKDEVAADLPPLVRTRVDVEMVATPAYQKEEKAVLDWVRKWQALHGDEARKMMGPGGGFLELRGHLTKLRKQAALGKIGFVRDWVEPLVESGERVVFFAYHKEVVARLAEALPGDVAILTGDTPVQTRRSILDTLDLYDFVVATMDSTGYGVDGIQMHASHVAFVELDWTPTKHEQCEGRLHRIGQRDHVNAWYIVAANTIEREVMGVLESKWADIQGVVEGRDAPDEAFLGQLVARLAKLAPQPG
ncbi:MAG: SWI/SNF-related matrix-associated actin-dependent regulator of chromatin subfamily A-like protein 1 [Thermoplasmata archaeon]|jgi:SNF2 family DNA or RNA helicase|nr:SWI/SNF-related matrix-associated actin-dependent regulator of chromatin subfamily A-like protein 1 [Thermoplasmata archaeon]